MTLHWHTEPFLLISLTGMLWLYLLAVIPLREALFGQVALPRRQLPFFVGGLLIIYLAIASPIDQIGERYLLSVHMLQHMLLIYCAPICIYLGLPHWLIDYPLVRLPWLRHIWKVLVHPAVAATLFTVNFTAWHIPWAYEAALQNRLIHILEHALMFSCAALVFWSLMTPSRILPALHYPGRLLLIFAVMVGQLPVFGFLAFAGVPLYPTYEWAPRITNLSAEEDQVLAAVLMKIVGMFFGLLGLGLNFYRWWMAEGQTDIAPATQKISTSTPFQKSPPPAPADP